MKHQSALTQQGKTILTKYEFLQINEKSAHEHVLNELRATPVDIFKWSSNNVFLSKDN